MSICCSIYIQFKNPANEGTLAAVRGKLGSNNCYGSLGESLALVTADSFCGRCLSPDHTLYHYQSAPDTTIPLSRLTGLFAVIGYPSRWWSPSYLYGPAHYYSRVITVLLSLPAIERVWYVGDEETIAYPTTDTAALAMRVEHFRHWVQRALDFNQNQGLFFPDRPMLAAEWEHLAAEGEEARPDLYVQTSWEDSHPADYTGPCMCSSCAAPMATAPQPLPLVPCWSSEPPKVPGWYWVRSCTMPQEIRKFTAADIEQLMIDLAAAGWQARHIITNLKVCEWAGPIPSPAEP